jgi:ribonucleotide monophosphatase NagD (HAD superfamily)
MKRLLLILDWDAKIFKNENGGGERLRLINELLTRCREKKLDVAIASETSDEQLEQELRGLESQQLYNLAEPGIHSWENHLVSILDRSSRKPEETVLVSDAFARLFAAKNLGIGTITVNGGRDNELRLAEIRPESTATSLRGLIRVIENGG